MILDAKNYSHATQRFYSFSDNTIENLNQLVILNLYHLIFRVSFFLDRQDAIQFKK